MPKLILVMGVAGCLLGLGTAHSVQAAGEPTLDSVAVSPASSVPQDTKVTITVKARPADPKDVLAYVLWTKNGAFTEFGPLYPESAVQYLPPPFSPGPGKINLTDSGWSFYENADGVLTFTADAVPGNYLINCGVTVADGPNKNKRSSSSFSLTVTPIIDAPKSAAAQIEDPRFDFDIVIAKDAIPSEVYAAQEFRRFFAEASGVNLPVVTKIDRPDRHIFIGPGKAFRNSTIGFNPEKMGAEDLRIVVRDGNIAIAGGRPRGTLYGVYTFLEDYLGVRFLTCDHTYVPVLKTWPVAGPIDRAYHPPLEFRHSDYRETNRNLVFAAKLRCNTVSTDAKLGGVTGRTLISHSFAYQIPSSKYGQEHPEYFALVGGKRLAQSPNNKDDSYTQPCLTNPDVLRIVTEAVLAEIKSNPSAANVSVSQNDNGSYCRCAKCAALDAHEGTPMGSLLAFVNAVADEVAKVYPKVKVGTLAYSYSRKPPRTIKPRPNVQIQLCSLEASSTIPIQDKSSKFNASFCQDLTDWGQICDDISIWYYNVDFGNFLIPTPTLRVLEPNIRFFVANNARGIYMEAAYTTIGGEFSDLKNYLTSRLLWNPNLEGAEVMNEFLTLHYGKAAPPIRRFINRVHDNAKAKGIDANYYSGNAADFGLDAPIAKAGLEAFDEALRLADDEGVRVRVEKASICAYRLAIDDACTWDDKKGPLSPEIAGRTRPYVKRLFELCAKYGVDRFSESLTIEKVEYPDGRKWKGWRPILRERFRLKEGESF